MAILHVVDLIISVILFGVPLFILKIKKHRRIDRNELFLEKYSKFKVHHLLHVLTGIYFACTYLAFRYWHTPWYLFSPLHAYALIASLIMPVALAYLTKGTNKAKHIALVMSVILFLSPLTRPFILAGPFRYLGDGAYRTSFVNFEYAIPLNICNISALLYLFALLLPKRHTVTGILKNYMITLGFFGGIINNVQSHNGHVNFFWYYFNWESYLVHALIMIIPVFMLLTGQLNINKKHQLYNLIWLVPTYLFMGFVLNPWVGFNFWFTAPIDFLAMLPQAHYLTLFGGTVYPIYMTIVFLIVMFACTLLYSVFKYVEEKMTPFFIDEYISFDLYGDVGDDSDLETAAS